MTLLLDWLSREGHYLLGWWLWMTLAGAAALPIGWRLLGGLPDRGYTLARALGLMLLTVLHWLLGSYGFLDNSRGSLMLCWLFLLAAGGFFCWRQPGGFDLRQWWRENRSLVVVSELLFALLFVVWAIYRAHQPDLFTTEKPMELAFISASQRSAVFPPADPWMSGYAISYYYLGYLMSSALSLLSGVNSLVAFSLTNASLFALAGLCAFGLVYNLARSHGGRRQRNWTAMAAGMLAAVMLTVMGNFQFLLIEAPYQSRAAPQGYFDFWGIQERANFPAGGYAQQADAALSLDATDWSYWWWFRASRVLTDYDLDGRLMGVQPIDEFPAFSFVLADNHPHVLALPYAVMVMGFMLNLLLLRRAPSAWEVALYGLGVGGLAFLNAWDGPIYLCGLLGAEGLRRLMTSERGRLEVWDWLGLVKFGAGLTAVAAVVYLPYLVGFRSQVGGILPNLVTPTYFPRFFIMFGPFVVLLGLYLLAECWQSRGDPRWNLRLGLQISAVLFATGLGLTLLLSPVVSFSDARFAMAGMGARSSQGGVDLLIALLQRRLAHSPTAMVLLLGMALAIARLLPARRDSRRDGFVAVRWITYEPAVGFALLLMALGMALALGVEFFYLRDNFGVRINTVFKFYYQVWALWSMAAAFAVYRLLSRRGSSAADSAFRVTVAALTAVCLFAGCAYTVAATHHRAWIESGRLQAQTAQRYSPPPDWTSSRQHVADGARVASGTLLFSRTGDRPAGESDEALSSHAGIILQDGDGVVVQKPLSLDGNLGALSADDRAVIACLSALIGADDAVVAEAVRSAYDIQFGRVGALAGIPTVLGWENHERQWRGATYGEIAGTRADDLRRLYTAPDFAEMQSIIERLGITHILYGQTERMLYGGLADELMRERLPTVCESGRARVYAAALTSA